jgi:hypothetical protein
MQGVLPTYLGDDDVETQLALLRRTADR